MLVINSACKSLAIILLASSTLTACNKDDNNDTPQDQTITGVVVANQNFSTLEQAVVKANLQGTLSGAGPYTVFAPDNDAFQAAGITSDVLNTLSKEQLTSILLYHTLPGKITADQVPAGPNASVITASGDSVFVTKKSSDVFVNGIKVKEANINATNGVIHKLNGVLMPPMGNIVETAQMDQYPLDSLVKAIVRANNEAGGDPTLIDALSLATITVFAPNNEAFSNLLTALGINDINDIPIATLVAVLKYHVLGGRAFSSDLMNGTIAPLGGGNLTVNLTNGSNGGPTIAGAGNGGQGANIIATNIIARNGVVHLIDKVLLP